MRAATTIDGVHVTLVGALTTPPPMAPFTGRQRGPPTARASSPPPTGGGCACGRPSTTRATGVRGAPPGGSRRPPRPVRRAVPTGARHARPTHHRRRRGRAAARPPRPPWSRRPPPPPLPLRLSPALDFSEAERVRDVAWYPPMSSASPPTCVFAVAAPASPVRLHDAATGGLRATYTPTRLGEFLDPPYALAWTAGGGALLAGGARGVAAFDPARPAEAPAAAVAVRRVRPLGVVSALGTAAGGATAGAVAAAVAGARGGRRRPPRRLL
ncbi:hypothetical protein BU14_0219s0025 [Porphyra umbilicalis]|uniref:Uncharacterized protein n=1 Tax=Porphyra umbilicalis TaxID=2786 RepID=A0A1X6P4Z0_PORUM|nr:hypothetical protein BU14_0219s0025 [Porphyra umbilicalis]|eukprot:OSX75825.1 hypothetical protein BU14_0219s0025 [Porphyra umbilicalis]